MPTGANARRGAKVLHDGIGCSRRNVERGALFLTVAGLALFLGSLPASADTELVERDVPFEVPKTLPFPQAYVADAAPGTNGTAHLVVTTAIGAFYLWLNTSTGEVIETVNLTEKGFLIAGFDYYYYSSSSDGFGFRYAIVAAQGSRVMVAHPFGYAGADVMFFDEGGAQEASLQRQFFPITVVPPMPSYAYWYLTGFTLMENARDPGRPSIVWARSAAYGSYGYFGATEVGRIDVDFASGTTEPAYQVVFLANTTVPYGLSSLSYTGDYPDAWRTGYQSAELSGVIDASGDAWIFGLFTSWWCSYYNYYGSCGSTQSRTNWSAIAPDARVTPLADLGALGPYYYYPAATVGSAALAAPDDSVAAFLTVSTGGRITVHWARADGLTASASNSTIAGYPATGTAAYLRGTQVRLVVADLVNGTRVPGGRMREFSGWPDGLVEAEASSDLPPVERFTILSSGASLRLLAGTLRDATNMSEALDRSRYVNASFARSWPAVLDLSSPGGDPVDVLGWQELVPAVVVSSAVASLPGGVQVGIVTTMENGTGRARVLTGRGSPPQFNLSAPLDIGGAVYGARVTVARGAAVAVIQARFPVPLPSSSYGRTGYIMVILANEGPPSAPMSVYGLSGVRSDSSWTMDWRLMASDPNPLLLTALGLFSLDPWNESASFRLALYSPSYPYTANLSKLYRTASEKLMLSPAGWYGSCSSSCLPVIDAWTAGSDLYLAFVVGNTSSSSYDFLPNSTPVLRVVRWMPNDTTVWHDEPLWTGRADDFLFFGLSVELKHRLRQGGGAEVWIMLRQESMWERLYRVEVSVSPVEFTARELVRQEVQISMGHIVDGLLPFGDGIALLRTTDQLYPYYNYWGTGLQSGQTFNGTSNETFKFPVEFLNCWYWYGYYYYYYYYAYYYYVGCAVWSAIEWADSLGVILFDGGAPRFFAPNHPPSAPRLLAPADAERLVEQSLTFRVTPSVDVDLDPLTYRFVVTDDSGREALNQTAAGPQLLAVLPDGEYSWTCFVSDGFVTVESPDRFHFVLDGSPPFADAGGPYIIGPGDGLTLNGSRSYDARGVALYRWVVGGASGLAIEGPNATVPLGWSDVSGFFGAGAIVPVTLTVRDRSGRETTDDTLIILSQPAIGLEAAVLTPRAVEGGFVELGVNVSWGALRFTWLDAPLDPTLVTVVWSFPDGSASAGLRSRWMAPDSGRLVVNVTAVAGSGSVGFLAVSVEVANLDPVASGTGPLQLDEGDTGSFSLNATDPSPVDAISLGVRWEVQGGISLESVDGFHARVKGLSNGPARVTAVVRDKDGGEARVEFSLKIAEFADPAGAVWVAAVGSTWVDLRWEPTGESDFDRYEILIRDEAGKLLRTDPVGKGARETARAVVAGLSPSRTYSFEVVVVAQGDVRSLPSSVRATTAPPAVEPVPPAPQPGPGPSPQPLPEGAGPSAATLTAGAGFEIYAWLMVLLSALGGGAYALAARRRMPEN